MHRATTWIDSLLNGRISSVRTGHQQNDATNISSTSQGGKNGQSLHGAITSALWAIARTPALVNAVERVETDFGDKRRLSRLLHLLRDPSNLSNAPRAREAFDAADVFLKEQNSSLSLYGNMEPMDVIRGIVGLCGDSDQVLEEAVETTYRTTLKCTYEGCTFKKEAALEKEEKLRCKVQDAQLMMERRLSSTAKESICDLCARKYVAKRYIVENTSPCLVATWSALSSAKAGQDMLFVRTNSGEDLRFRLSVMIAIHLNKMVCVFREGPNFYRVEGRAVKPIAVSEWKNVQPCLALFTRQAYASYVSPCARNPRGTGYPHSAVDRGGGKTAGRKRRRQENGNSSSSSSRQRDAVAAAEVIEVDDDDSDRGDADVPPGGEGGGGGGGSGRNTGTGSGSSNFGSGSTPPSRRRRPGVHACAERENRASHKELTAEKEDGQSRRRLVPYDNDNDEDDDDDDDPAATKIAESDASAGWMSQRRTPDSPPARRGCSERHKNNSSSAATGFYLDSFPRQTRNASPSHFSEREVHDVDDDATSASPSPPSPVTSKGMLHPSGVAMPFIGPARPPEPKPKVLPPRPQPPGLRETSDDSPWLKPISRPASNVGTAGNRSTLRRRLEGRSSTAGAAGAFRMSGRGGGGGIGAAKNVDGQKTIFSPWEAREPSSSSSGGGGGGGGGDSRPGKQEDEEWRRPRGKGVAAAGAARGGPTGGSYGSSGGGRQLGLRSRGKVTEDLTGADESLQGINSREASWGGAGAGGRCSSGLPSRSSRSMPNDATLTTIRGINLQQDHFDRIVDSDGWLTSQIIDIRVKQLQELFPQHLYFDTSFFGFLCPTTEPSGAFVVDYERVAGWTKRSRLPGGKSSLFDVQKLFIPINQGNIHWVLVVVDMGDDADDDGGGGGGGSGGAKLVSFFDSLKKDGTKYVEAVQQYLVSELSSRDKTRQVLFAPRTRPPPNAPRQHNSSDCGVLMLHVMEELSTGPASDLTSLTQEEIMSLRLQLVAKIRE
ncbi:unnamed protein product [Pylaiella littoralis]